MVELLPIASFNQGVDGEPVPENLGWSSDPFDTDMIYGNLAAYGCVYDSRGWTGLSGRAPGGSSNGVYFTMAAGAPVVGVGCRFHHLAERFAIWMGWYGPPDSGGWDLLMGDPREGRAPLDLFPFSGESFSYHGSLEQWFHCQLLADGAWFLKDGQGTTMASGNVGFAMPEGGRFFLQAYALDGISGQGPGEGLIDDVHVLLEPPTGDLEAVHRIFSRKR